MIRKFGKLFVFVVGIMFIIPTNVFAESNIVLTSDLEYLVGSNTGLVYTIDAENSIKKISVDDTEISTSNYVISSDSLSINNAYLDSLTLGSHSISITYLNDDLENTSSTSFKVIENKVEEQEVTVDGEENDSNITSMEDVVNSLPDYYFVSVKEDNSQSETVTSEIYDSVVESISESGVNADNYDINVVVDSVNDIFDTDISVTNESTAESYIKNGTVIYSNADDYVEEDFNKVNEFINEHDFVYKNSYELVDDFSNESYDSTEVKEYVSEMFENTGIDYSYNGIESSDDSELIGKILMFVNSKYYASSNFYYKNVPYIYVPLFVDDVNSYVASCVYDILVDKYNLSGHTLLYKDGHLYDETTGKDFGEFDYIVSDNYEFNYVSGETVYEKASGKNIELVFDYELGDANSLTIGDVEVSNDSYRVEDKTLVINSNYLDTLTNNNYDVKLITNYGEASTSITVIPKQYVYIDGADSIVDKGVKKTLTVRINADYNKFVNIYLNNNILNSKDYSIREGSTIIDISYDYLKELSNGVYKLKTIFTDGEAITNLSISGKKPEYKVSSVSNQNYEKKSNKDVSYNLNNISNIVNVDVNGVSISNSYYYVSGNSISIRGSYLDNLNNGNYSISIKFDDGSVDSSLSIKDKPSTSSHSSSTSSGSYYVPSKTYYRPYVYNNYNYDYDYDDVEEHNVEEVISNEQTLDDDKKEEDNLLEVVEDEKPNVKDTTKKNTKKKTKSMSSKKVSKKASEKKNNSSKKSIFDIFKKKDDSSKKTEEKLEEKKDTSSKKSIFSIFKKKDDSSKKTEEKLEEKKDTSSKKSIFDIFKKEDDDSKTETKKSLSVEKNTDSEETKPMIINIDSIVNSRIFIATLIVLICGLSCYILYMVTKKDEEE